MGHEMFTFRDVGCYSFNRFGLKPREIDVSLHLIIILQCEA